MSGSPPGRARPAWSRSRQTLVLTAITQDTGLVDALVADPTIRNVYVGDRPTWWLEPGIPHDGYLGGFLMEAKAVVRA